MTTIEQYPQISINYSPVFFSPCCHNSVEAELFTAEDCIDTLIKEGQSAQWYQHCLYKVPITLPWSLDFTQDPPI